MPILGIIASAYVAPIVYKFWGMSEEAVVASTDGISWDFKPSNNLSLTKALSSVGAGDSYAVNNRLIINNNFSYYSVTTNGTTWDYYNNNACAPAYGIIYQDSKYVAIIGSAQSIGTSTDLITWTYSTIPVLTTLYEIVSVTYGNGTYVAVGANDYCITSTDATTWTSRSTPLPNDGVLKGVVYGDKFVVVGSDKDANSATIATSTDGITWTERTSAAGWTNLRSVTYDSTVGRYVAVGTNHLNDNVAQYSTNGITWTNSASVQAGDVSLASVASNNGTYVAVFGSASANFWTSTDGSTWTNRTTYNSDNVRQYKPAYFDSKWWFGRDYTASGGGTILVNTTNFTTWTVITGNPTKTPVNISTTLDRFGYMNGEYVFVSGDLNSSSVREVFDSTDLVTWTKNSMQTGGVNTIFYGNGVYVAGGASGALQTSTNLVTWTTRTSGFGTTTIQAGTYGATTYVLVGANGVMTTSTNATTWTTRTSTFGTSTINLVRYLNNLFIACGNGGTISTSTNATTWTTRTSGVTTALRGLAYGASRYIVVGNSNVIRSSTDAVTWSAVTNPAGITDSGFAWYDASFNNDIFLVSGFYTDSTTQGLGALYLTSTNGTTWTSRRNDKIAWYGTYSTGAV